MSRIGKLPILLPEKVKVNMDGRTLTVEGPKGRVVRAIPPDMKVIVDEGKREIRVERPSDLKPHRALHGLTRALIAGMVEGVSKGYEKSLDIVGVGYGAAVEKKKLVLRLGFAVPVEVAIPDGIQIDKPVSGTLFITGIGNVPMVRVRMTGADKQVLGDFAARLRKLRPPNVYVGKGIRYTGEEIKLKPGKTFVSGR